QDQQTPLPHLNPRYASADMDFGWASKTPTADFSRPWQRNYVDSLLRTSQGPPPRPDYLDADGDEDAEMAELEDLLKPDIRVHNLVSRSSRARARATGGLMLHGQMKMEDIAVERGSQR